MEIFAIIAVIVLICTALTIALCWNRNKSKRLRYRVVSKCPYYRTFYAVKDRNNDSIVSDWFEGDQEKAQKICNRLNNLPYLTGDPANDRQQIETYLNKTSEDKKFQQTFIKE
jgi:hypothetical protein